MHVRKIKMRKKIKKYLPKIIGIQLSSLYLINPKKATKKAYYLFCSPRRGRIKPEQKDFLNTAKKEILTIQQTPIQTYHWEGSGNTVLLIHGWESNTHRWKELIAELQEKNFNIIAFDAPAHGNSGGKIINIPIYANIADVLVKKFTPDYLVGHSMGGMTSVYYQHFFTESTIKKTVLLGAPSELDRIMYGYQKILNLNNKFMADLEQIFVRKFNFHFKEFSVANFAKTIQNPTLIIHDQYDKIVPLTEAEKIKQNLKDVELLITEGAGHSLNNQMINQKITHFLLNHKHHE